MATVGCEFDEATKVSSLHLHRIEELALALCDVPAGWDNDGAASVDRDALDHAVTLAARITCSECLVPSIVPTKAGNVILDWTYGSDHLEVEVFADWHYEVLVDLPDAQGEFASNLNEDAHLELLAHWVTAVGIRRLSRPF
jgi:hypothetical protein